MVTNLLISARQTGKLFCYRCISRVLPLYKFTQSEYYVDVDNLPVMSLLPHCPHCEREVYSKAYHSAANDYINYIHEEGVRI